MKWSALVPSGGMLLGLVVGAGLMWSVWMGIEGPDDLPPRRLPPIDAKLLGELKEYLAWHNGLAPAERGNYKGVGEPITEKPEVMYRRIQEFSWDFCITNFLRGSEHWRPMDPKEGYQPWMTDAPNVVNEIAKAPYLACVSKLEGLSEVYGEAELREVLLRRARCVLVKRLCGGVLAAFAGVVMLAAIIRVVIWAIVYSRRGAGAVSA